MSVLPFLSGRATAQSTQPAGPPLEIARLESSILQARNAIKSGTFRVSLTRHQEMPGRWRDLSEEFTTSFDGVCSREDHPSGTNQGSTVSNSKWVYIYTRAAPNSLSMADRAWLDVRSFAPHDPLKLMLCVSPYDSTREPGVAPFFGTPGRTDFQLEDSSWQNQPAKHLTFVTHPNNIAVHREFWVLPEKNFNVVRAVASSGMPESPETWSIECTLAQVADNLWFPAAYTLLAQQAGQTTLREEARITVSHINEKLDPSLFEPVTMHIPVGILVHKTPADEPVLYQWDGAQIVPTTLGPVMAERSAAHSAAMSPNVLANQAATPNADRHAPPDHAPPAPALADPSSPLKGILILTVAAALIALITAILATRRPSR